VDAWHARSAARAVRGGRDGWPAARSVVFCGVGYPPPAGALPHLRAARVAPRAGYGYCSGGEAIAVLWHALLAGCPPAWQARGDEPRQVAGMARAAGLEPPYCVQLRLALHWWPPEYAAGVIAGYAAALPPGSSLAMTVALAGGAPSSGEARAGVSAAVAPVYEHSPEAVAAWVAGAGMTLAGGVADVRGWAGGIVREGAPGWFAGAVALRPLASGDGAQPGRGRLRCDGLLPVLPAVPVLLAEQVAGEGGLLGAAGRDGGRERGAHAVHVGDAAHQAGYVIAPVAERDELFEQC